ncbi:transketolase [Chelatococcus composti]|jgi:Pyruvate dehydrogenase complex, dehydrogenase (E1) component|uniref:Pyruvate dehydrogenase E1 component n=1 Tax=Chelatococcus composti TaxID=1743235 RepID=A0A841KBA7_9HYPH|nr:transketolase [Chelatococcus composti]MBB6169777.1 pyruvate dehydrogenase E1 component [Chelatococcus composti]MBS7736252.1 transketolase [Chelatococcus composti]PZN46325.1 MAG: transketolase [Pseudomonadota bacterium]GGG49893.1 pyruvate dehydrogenase E1 component [Chelatococcus composti]
MRDEHLAYLAALEKKVLWLATWTIHHANHIRGNDDGLKIGGHQASSASLATIMTALYFSALRPQDRVAVKPHASPVFHAIQYLLGNQSKEKLVDFRAYRGAQSYPSRTKDIDDVDFSTGSVGLGVAQTLFASLVQDYVKARGWAKDWPEGRMVALVGDAEMDEGNIFEALLEGWKQGLRNCWWIIDYNRQSLDAVIREGLFARFEALFSAFGWEVVTLKYGSLLEAAFREEGGEALRRWIDTCPNQLYSALTFQGGAAWRRRLLDDIGDQGPVTALIERRSDEELARLMTNLAGHDLPSLLAAFEKAQTHDRPVVFIAYTIKGFGLPLAGHKDNHAGLMTPAQMEGFRKAMNIRPGHEWDRFEGLDIDERKLQAFLDAVPFNARGPRRLRAARVPVPKELPTPRQAEMSTQQGFGLVLNEIARSDTALAERIVTTSPDVTVSTNLGPWVNRRGLFARETMVDTFRQERIPSTYNWEFSPRGQHMELGIAEMNLFIMLSALGLSHSLFGERLLPVGTLYDPFIARGLDALNYACYQDARFLLAATPSGITLAPEGGAHQSIATPLIGMAQDGLAAFEPAFVDELSVIMRFAFDYMQRNGEDGDDDGSASRSWLRDETGGSVYLRLSTRPIAQPQRTMSAELARDIIDGAYWLREPGPNAEIVVAYTGAIAPEAIAAVGLMAEDRRDVGLLAVTSADRLNAGWTAASRARERGLVHARSHIERLFEKLPPHCGIVTVLDGHPATLAWLGAVGGHRTRSLGVEHFGQTGSLADLYRHYGIDTEAIITAAQTLAPGRPIRHLRALG